MARRLDETLWRIARLHPGIVLLCYWATILLPLLVSSTAGDESGVISALHKLIGLPLQLSYPLFVVFLLSGRFASPAPRRLRCSVMAMSCVTVFCLFAAALDLFPGLRMLLDQGPVATTWLFLALLLGCVVAMIYLWIAAGRTLVNAERGPARSAWRTVGTILQFFYLPCFCIYFVQQRVRRLANSHGQPLPAAA